jgi:serine/threonine-protein kinase
VSHTLADVLRAEIDLKALPADTPAAVRTLLRRCLDRNVRNRLRDIGEARVALETAGQAPADAAPALPQARPASRLPWMITAAAVIVALSLTSLYWWKTRPVLRPVQRFDLPFTAPERLHPFLALSPDGTRLAYVVKGQDGIQRIHTRLLSEPEGTQLNGTEGAFTPFFSPDGQWLAFAAGGSLKKILLTGGTAVKLCDAADMRGGSWGEDGNIVFSPDNRSPLYRVPEAGGTAQKLTNLKAGEISHRHPQVLPGARSVLFSAGTSPSNFEESSVELLNLGTGEVKAVHRGGFAARYLNGYLLWAHEGALFSAAVDLEKAQLTSNPVPVLERLASDSGSGLGNFEISPAGIYVGMTGVSQNRTRSLAWLDTGGTIQPLPLDPKNYFAVRISPDGSRLAFSAGPRPKCDLFICDLNRAQVTQVTFDGQASTPIWAPDGKHLVLDTIDETKLYWLRADGSAPPEVLYTTTPPLNNMSAYTFLPESKGLIVGPTGRRNAELWVLPLDLTDPDHPKAGKPEPISGSEGRRDVTISPDGRWLAYIVRQDLKSDLYVEPFPPTGAKWLVAGEAAFPRWSKASQELIFVGKGPIMAIRWHAEGKSFVVEKPRPWAATETLKVGGNWDIAPDVKRAIILAGADTDVPAHLTFLLNFADDLRRRIPK